MRYSIENSGLCSDKFKEPLQMVLTLHFSCVFGACDYQEHTGLHIYANSDKGHVEPGRPLSGVAYQRAISLGSLTKACMYGILFLYKQYQRKP